MHVQRSATVKTGEQKANYIMSLDSGPSQFHASIWRSVIVMLIIFMFTTSGPNAEL